MENEGVVLDSETPEAINNELNETGEDSSTKPDSNTIPEGETLDNAEEEHVDAKSIDSREPQVEDVAEEGDEPADNELEREQIEPEQKEDDEKKATEQPVVEEHVEEEERYVEEPPPDPAAPFNFSDSAEDLKPEFILRPDQIAEVEQLWELYQNYTPAYTDIDQYITEKELVYMLQALLLMTYTSEQLQELIAFCVRPPHPEGHINYYQFLKMVTLRQREFPIEEELRTALQVLDPGKTGTIDREYFKELLLKQGHKLPQKQLDNLIKEVDISNDGTIGIEDVVGTMCIDLNKEDLLMLRDSLFPPEEPPVEE